MGRVLRTISGARLRYFSSKGGVCSLKFALDCGRPASRRATFSPDSARRLHAQPPEAPEPTTMTSYFFVVDSAKGSIPPKMMIVDSKQCHDLRMLASQAGPGQLKRMERTSQPRISLTHLSLEPACQKLSLVDMAVVTMQRPSVTIAARICFTTRTPAIQTSARPLS